MTSTRSRRAACEHAAALLVPLFACATAQGDDAAPAQPADAAAPAEPTPESKAIGLQVNVDVTNAYFYRGILQQDHGVIVQPAAKLTLNLMTDGDFKLDALVGTWNSFGDNAGTNTSALVEYWYESDLIAGFSLTKGKLSLTTTYTFLTSPSDAFQTVQELDMTLAFDDSEYLGPFALHPYALLAVETGANASDGADSNNGVYLELGVAPGFTFLIGETTVAVSFPMSVGLSLYDYYQDAAGNDSGFGFFQAGARASLPLPFGERLGQWSLNAGVYGLFLGSQTAAFNGGDHDELIATVGVQVNF